MDMDIPGISKVQQRVPHAGGSGARVPGHPATPMVATHDSKSSRRAASHAGRRGGSFAHKMSKGIAVSPWGDGSNRRAYPTEGFRRSQVSLAHPPPQHLLAERGKADEARHHDDSVRVPKADPSSDQTASALPARSPHPSGRCMSWPRPSAPLGTPQEAVQPRTE